MKISMKRVIKLTSAETIFVFSMMKSFGEPISEKKAKNYRKNKKQIKTHHHCTAENPCLFDLDCPAWNDCTDEKFIQYRIILEKCRE